MSFTRREFTRSGLAVLGALSATSSASVSAAPARGAPLAVGAGDESEPLGGQPPAGAAASVADFDYQIRYQRAFEAVLWAMPAVAMYSFRRAAFDGLGLKDNDIIAYSATATPRLEAITANSTTPYITAFTDLRNGPVVLEVPPAGPDGSVYGQVVDAWQFTIADVGPSGLDKGKGARFLFTPPGYGERVPDGYIHVASPNYRISLAFRSVPAPGKTAEDAYRYARKLRMYALSQARTPPEQRFVDPIDQRYPTLPFYDERHFHDMHAILSVEPVKEHDKVMMGMLASLGIEHGKPFTPDDKARKAMRQAAIDAWFYMQQWFENFPAEKRYWPDRHYASLLQADRNRRFTFVYDDRIDLIERAAEYFWCTYMPKELGDNPATQYLMAVADAAGKPLQAGKRYRLDVPAQMPVRQFWALTVYDRATNAFIYSKSGRTTLSSYDVDRMKKNADGGVTLFIGPSAPAGYESNWIPTEGKRPLPAMRFYGPTEALNTKRFKLDDFVLVE
ncbi:hypothetical protein CEG14_01165 [Bordetella genomosp. 1]|uniref:DUF1254 domain-containing protein n=1 Tax=Bordetella genomosp. 1 TaxID=1395607 RepID=A0A261STR4_9BORD|nr:hypothetical protein CEG14_01165 [Bordetella genomosp. 1]